MTETGTCPRCKGTGQVVLSPVLRKTVEALRKYGPTTAGILSAVMNCSKANMGVRLLKLLRAHRVRRQRIPKTPEYLWELS